MTAHDQGKFVPSAGSSGFDLSQPRSLVGMMTLALGSSPNYQIEMGMDLSGGQYLAHLPAFLAIRSWSGLNGYNWNPDYYSASAARLTMAN
jgi:hypothetical protein